MAPDKKDKKRKAAAATAAADSPAKKTKKVETKPTKSTNADPKPAPKKTKEDGAEKSAAKLKINGEPARQVKPRKRAADFLSDNEENEAEDAIETKVEAEKKSSNKKTKKADGTAAPAPTEKTNKPKNDTKAKGNTKVKKPEIVAEESDDDEMEDKESASSDASASEDEDDRTVALIRGFESSGDEDESGDEGLNPDGPIPKIPDSKKAKRKILKKQKENKQEADEPGTVYVGRIPHGFYEHQMRAYFSQFGEISRLRLSRNRITGASKHYAFIEFKSTSVAKVVAGTMDNYLMYGHILKCKYVPQEQLHPDIWKGANRRFKRTPWNRIEKKRLDKGKTREQWSERIEREQKKRLAKVEQLKALGYEIELPQLKSVDEVPVQQEEDKVIEAPETAPEEPPKVIEAPKEEKKADDTPKKSKKDKKKGAQSPAQETPKEQLKEEASVATTSPAAKAGAKAKKAKKTKAKA